jgi:hypothetical protein
MGTCLPANSFSRGIVPGIVGDKPQVLNPPWTKESGYEQCGMFPGQTASFGRNGSVGLCLDSAEPFDMGQSCAYQNSMRDLVITAVDIGLYASKWTNANNCVCRPCISCILSDIERQLDKTLTHCSVWFATSSIRHTRSCRPQPAVY